MRDLAHQKEFEGSFPDLACMILAAGKGSRMRSSLPKVLHPIAGRPILGHVLRLLDGLNIQQRVLVLSPELAASAQVKHLAKDASLCTQENPRGTGDAAASAALAFEGISPIAYADCRLVAGKPKPGAKDLLVCLGDTPALDPQILRAFIARCRDAKADLGVLALDHPNPAGYGRIICDGNGQFQKIVEHRDAKPEERVVTLCNSGVIYAKVPLFFSLLQDLKPTNSQGEYYLTDIFGLAVARKLHVLAYPSKDWESFAGINDRAQLAEVENFILRRKRSALMIAGVSFAIPESTYVEMDVEVGADTVIGPGCCLRGSTQIGSAVVLGAHVVLENARIENGARIEDGSIIRGRSVSLGGTLPPLSLLI